MLLLRDLEARTRERVPIEVYDYYAGAAGDERTLAENAEAWQRLWLRPRALVDVGSVDPSVTVLGHRLRAPVILAPIAAQRMLHPDGEARECPGGRGRGQPVLPVDQGDGRSCGGRGGGGRCRPAGPLVPALRPQRP